ncbi:MAG: hypothetical protein M3N18_01075 [Actinomycetota bacterium]|nr:hypothetical protein [Actinomycetota bacterium]
MSGAHHDEHGGGTRETHAAPGGLAISAEGYTLEAVPKTFEAGREEAFGFRILDQAGRAVRDFDEQHGERMHLIVVRRDLTHYQHLHPSLGPDGTWSVPLTLPEPGVYRAFADFSVGGRPLTLGGDLTVPGNLEFAPLPDPTSVVRVDGYEVTLGSGLLPAGAESPLTFRITRQGQDIEQLEPYLGALGHLVALREGDLAFLHVHPTGGGGSEVTFHAVFPSIGRYRLFLQFAHAGRVRTAAFTVEVSP